jgi:hypothetical protein
VDYSYDRIVDLANDLRIHFGPLNLRLNINDCLQQAMEGRALDRAIDYEVSLLYAVPSEAGKRMEESTGEVVREPALTPLVIVLVSYIPEVILDALDVANESVFPWNLDPLPFHVVELKPESLDSVGS